MPYENWIKNYFFRYCLKSIVFHFNSKFTYETMDVLNFQIWNIDLEIYYIALFHYEYDRVFSHLLIKIIDRVNIKNGIAALKILNSLNLHFIFFKKCQITNKMINIYSRTSLISLYLKHHKITWNAISFWRCLTLTSINS